MDPKEPSLLFASEINVSLVGYIWRGELLNCSVSSKPDDSTQEETLLNLCNMYSTFDKLFDSEEIVLSSFVIITCICHTIIV